MATESADVVLMTRDRYDVARAIVLSRATLRTMHQNLIRAVACTVVAFPAAVGVFFRLVISPEVAALAMSGSSALVAVDALLRKRIPAGTHRQADDTPGPGTGPGLAAERRPA